MVQHLPEFIAVNVGGSEFKMIDVDAVLRNVLQQMMRNVSKFFFADVQAFLL